MVGLFVGSLVGDNVGAFVGLDVGELVGVWAVVSNKNSPCIKIIISISRLLRLVFKKRGLLYNKLIAHNVVGAK